MLNPKVALFFMAFLTQFVRLDVASPPLQLALLGLVVVAVAVIVELVVVMVATHIGRALGERSTIVPWFHRLFGGILIALGFRVVVTTR